MKDVSATPYAQRLLELHLPHGEIPRIDLYMDQLVGFLEETLAPLYQPDEKIITRSMVNNYVKQGVLAAAAAGKKYSRDHVAYLVVICTLKQTFSLSEIDLLIRRQIATFDTGVAYDYYCDAFEAAVRTVRNPPRQPQGLASGDAPGDFERDLVLASTAAVAYTLHIKASVALIREEPAGGNDSQGVAGPA